MSGSAETHLNRYISSYQLAVAGAGAITSLTCKSCTLQIIRDHSPLDFGGKTMIVKQHQTLAEINQEPGV